MKDQNYANHSRVVPGFHLVLGALLIFGTIASLVNIYIQITTHDAIFDSILIAVLFISGVLLFWYARQFATKVQDRAIRAEETIRYYKLTGKDLDSRLTMAQIIALRFAPDDEFLVLTDRAVRENLSNTEIKKSIKKWKADHHRA
jgi:hypothetical protein